MIDFKHLPARLRVKGIAILLLSLTGWAMAVDYVAIEEKLGNYLPAGLVFTKEDSNEVFLQDLIDKPTLIAPVYYNCPGLCTPIMDGMVRLLNQTDLEIGKDFDIINISFHEAETPDLAATKKRNYTGLLENPESGNYWKFLTGDRMNINNLLETLGYSVIWQGEDILHPAAVMIVDPEGQIVKYIHGTKFNPVEFKMAIQDAADRKIAPTITRVMKMCFNYEPRGREKQKSVTILGFILMIGIGTVLFVLYPPLRNKS
jgi:protein SCO1/2